MSAFLQELERPSPALVLSRRANRFLRYTGGESQAKLLTYELFS